MLSQPEIRTTPLWQLRQLLAPNPGDYGSNFEAEIKRLGVLGLQFASFVAIVLPSAILFFEFAIWYFQRDEVFITLLNHNIENFAIVLVGISALFLSRTDFGEAHANLVAIGCATIAEMIATLASLLQGQSETYPPFVISLLILTAVVPLRPVTVALIGFLLIAFNFVVEAVFTYAAILPDGLDKRITSVPIPFYLTITLVCTSLTAVIYRLRLKNFQSLEALKESQASLQRELAVAGNIQMRSLPRVTPETPGFSIAGACLTATEVGGDYYDYINSRNGKLGVIVGDVSGKGTFAALYMSKLQGIIHALQQYHDSPKSLLCAVNEQIYQSIERNCFITMIYALIDLKKRRVTISRAGHNATLFIREDGAEHVVPKGIGVGLAGGDIFNAELEEKVVKLKAGDILVFYTDGITEARNRKGDEYGEERLIEVVRRNRQLDANGVCEKIMENVKSFIGYANQHDDMTVLVAKAL